MQRLFTLAAMVVASISLPSHAVETYKIAAGEYWPYTYLENGQIKGVAHDVVMEMAKRSGLALDLQVFPWARALELAKNGLVDAAFPVNRSAAMESIGIYLATPLYTSQYRAFVRRGDEFELRSSGDLVGMTVGINAKSILGDDFEALRNQGLIKIDEGARSSEANLKKLLAGRMKILIIDELTGLHAADAMGVSSRISMLPSVFTEVVPQYLIVSKFGRLGKNIELLKSLDEALKSMTADGTIGGIFLKYCGRLDIFECRARTGLIGPLPRMTAASAAH